VRNKGGNLLEGKIVLVTGVGPGLGRDMVRAIAREGAIAICMARTGSYLERVVTEIEEAGGEAVAATGDVANEADCLKVADLIGSNYGRLDGLVNSAFTAGEIAPLSDGDLQAWRQALEVNLIGALRLVQLTLPYLEKDGGGAIVNINTNSAMRPMKGQGAYGTSKAALEFATRLLAVELGPKNIRANTVYCGPMLGDNLENAMQAWAGRQNRSYADIRATLESRFALGRIPHTSEPAELVVALLSDYCSVVTGAAILASGGSFIENQVL
jgi:NAD(P)-dependent dehydrogenase (short-subunit alcohol dehydrogenase family)